MREAKLELPRAHEAEHLSGCRCFWMLARGGAGVKQSPIRDRLVRAEEFHKSCKPSLHRHLPTTLSRFQFWHDACTFSRRMFGTIQTNGLQNFRVIWVIRIGTLFCSVELVMDMAIAIANLTMHICFGNFRWKMYQSCFTTDIATKGRSFMHGAAGLLV